MYVNITDNITEFWLYLFQLRFVSKKESFKMSGKKKLTQEELRKVMNNTKKKLGVEKKKIHSPLAKYNSLGQLTCAICKSVISNELVWPTHLNSKKHKENINLAKQDLEKAKSAVSAQKRSASPFREPHPVKKIKSILKNSNPSAVHQPKPKSGLPDDFYDKPSSSTTTNGTMNSAVNGVVNGKPNFPQMPPISKESSESVKAEEEKDEDKQQKGKENPASLPEGFFDDPVLDAKIRNVEYKNPMDEEFEKFMKVIKEEEAQANQIMADDQEEATVKRQEDVIEEQMQRLSRVMDLVKLKEKMKAAEKKQEIKENESSSSDDEDFDEFIDWRAKKSFK
ncbi:zinc finger protein 830 [Belonocnema kinseyi]|uniref:zinc finger protein 830 n=1 Tax=Belonocnema kinseyi TaxID=2817044 RepID=UPI00143D7945|nr:zinc finger protein 830 [Belonocnema kinseyi]